MLNRAVHVDWLRDSVADWRRSDREWAFGVIEFSAGVKWTFHIQTALT